MVTVELESHKSDTRLREAHHRIANNLALIAGFVRLQSSQMAKAKRSLTAEEVCVMLDEVGVRIETVGRLHHLLAGRPDGDLVNLGEYMDDTCGILSQSVCLNRPVTLRCDARPCAIEPERAGLLGLIVTELVTNSVKYAHPAGAAGRIDVSCRRPRAGDLILTVSDDGVGLPEGFDSTVDGGLGMRVVRSLAEQMGAVLDFDSSSLGLVVTVTAPAGEIARPALASSLTG
ncbi:sensor histidine kinase [Phenylobacterium sp.]|uniref:sensor histidine kinase n=1 Tax=Phenylobacterium sp. TaxID=1871053 RepID=UPI00356AF841